MSLPHETTGWELRTIDQQIEELLHSDISCSIALPRLPKRVALEDSKLLKGARVSVLDEDWDVSTTAREKCCFREKMWLVVAVRKAHTSS